MSKRMWWSLGAVTGALLAFAPPASADFVVTCESKENRYKYCSADVRNGAEVERQISEARCTYNTSWGYDRNGIWVDQGCRARFRVFERGGRPRPPNRDDDIDGGDIAAIIAVAIIAALESDDRSDRRERGHGRADAVKRCAQHAQAQEYELGARSVSVDSVEQVIPRGRRSYDVEFTLSAEYRKRPRYREYDAECTVQNGRVTSYYRN